MFVISAWPRVSLAVALVFTSLAAAAVADEPPSRPIVALERPTATDHSGRQALLREIVRQAFLVVAREEFSCRTRDAVLREPMPGEGKDADARVFRLDIEAAVGQPVRVKLVGVRNTDEVTSWSDIIPINYEREVPLVVVMNRVDQWMRGPFPTALKQAKLTPREAPADPPAKSVVTAEMLEPAAPEFVAQVALIRKLHEALAAEPDSVPLLAAITREYALLSTVTEIHWGLEHKVFMARALLYSERAIRRGRESVDAAWARTLVRMLSGLTSMAPSEVQRAEALAKKDNAEAKAPSWAETLVAYVRWDDQELGRLAEQGKPLAAYFQMLLAETAGSRDQRLAADNRLIEVHPECFRAIAALANEHILGIRRSVGGAQVQQFAISLPRLLQQIPELPEELTREPEVSDEDGGLEHHAALLKKLRGVNADIDRYEPSTAVIATLAENLTLVHANQILVTQFYMLGLGNVEDSIEEMQRLLPDHPYGPILGIYRRGRETADAAIKPIEPLPALGLSEAAFDQIWKDTLSREKKIDIAEASRVQRDELLTGLIAFVNDSYSAGEKRNKLPMLRRVAADSPAVVVLSINLDWPSVAARAPDWVETSRNIKVLSALAMQFEKLEDEGTDDDAKEKARKLAERCLVRMAEIENSFDNAEALASYYRRHGNFDRWKKITIESLSLPTYGLEVPHACSELADWMMDRGEWQEAEPYALQAAQSYSGSGLQSVARCMEGQERWEEAERNYRAKSRRYHGSWPDWYFFCRRTGRGDLDSASEFSREAISLMPEGEKNGQQMAVYYQLEGDFGQALRIHDAFHNHGTEGPYAILCSIVILDELGRTEERNKLTNLILGQDDTSSHGLFCDLVRRSGGAKSESGPAPLADADLELCYAYSGNENRPTNMAYFLGKLLLNRGDRERAIVWLQRAATSPRTQAWTCTLAGAELTRLGVPIAQRRKSTWADEFVDISHRLEAIDRFWNPKQVREAIQLAEQGVEANPKSAGLRLTLANLVRDSGDPARADDLYGKTLELVPHHSIVLTNRGKVREFRGREAEAIADYEAAIAAAPHFRTAHNNLAFIRAASSNPEFRNGQAALRHARTAIEIGPGQMGIAPVVLAAAHAEAGEFDEAVKLIEEAIAKKEYPEPERLTNWLESYRQKKPYRRTPVVPR